MIDQYLNKYNLIIFIQFRQKYPELEVGENSKGIIIITVYF